MPVNRVPVPFALILKMHCCSNPRDTISKENKSQNDLLLKSMEHGDT